MQYTLAIGKQTHWNTLKQLSLAGSTLWNHQVGKNKFMKLPKGELRLNNLTRLVFRHKRRQRMRILSESPEQIRTTVDTGAT